MGCSAVIPDGPAAAPRNDRKFLENCFSSNSNRRPGQNLSRSSGIWCLGTAGLRCSWCNVCSLPGANASPSNACLPATILPFAPELQALAAHRSTSSCCPRRFFLVSFRSLFCTSPTIINHMRPSRQFVLRNEPRGLWSNILGNNINSFHPLSWRTLSDRSNSNACLIQHHVHRLSIRALGEVQALSSSLMPLF